MKRRTAVYGYAGLILLFVTMVACGGSSDRTRFRVSVENVSPVFTYLASGSFAIPAGGNGPAPIMSGDMYSFRVAAPPGASLSFATMYVQSNDLFFAPGGEGIPLFDEQGMPVTGDVTASVHLWDAGTELNEEPGTGPHQAPRQSGPNTGPVDPDPAVRLVSDGFTYPPVDEVLRATIRHEGGNEFTVTIENISSLTPLAPGVYVVHSTPHPLFTEGTPDAGTGLESLAEDGDPAGLADTLAARTGLTSPFAPGVWALHQSGMPLFSSENPDRGLGLEALAEDGDPAELAAVLSGDPDVTSSGIFNTPEGEGAPGPLLPGARYSFVVYASGSDRLSFATMLVQSNDLFIAPDPTGIPLFDEDGEPLDDDVTTMVYLWDAGTEENQWPGAGPDQAPRQAGPDTGTVDPDRSVRLVDDRFSYPGPAQMIRILVAPE